jgi:hypothetical protein
LSRLPARYTTFDERGLVLAGSAAFVDPSLPALYFGFLAVMTITYLGLVQVAKGVLMRRAAM